MRLSARYLGWPQQVDATPGRCGVYVMLQLLPGTYFNRNQHRRVGGSDVHDARKDAFQGGQGTNNLVDHEDLINLLPEDDVLIIKAVFQPFDFFESFF
jgi:hypothetical protein